jgi:hypothetical protein
MKSSLGRRWGNASRKILKYELQFFYVKFQAGGQR